MILRLLKTIAFLLPVPITVARAQNYTMDWSTISGGGGTSTAAVYTITITIGQPNTGTSSGGNYSLSGGFWSLIAAVPTPGAPRLSIKLTGNTVMVYWPSPSTGFNPQVNSSLATTNWVTPAEAVQDDGSIKYMLVSPPAGNRFYRLKTP